MKRSSEEHVHQFMENVIAIGKSERRLGDIERSAGLCTGYLSRARNGKANITLKAAIDVSRLVGVSIRDLCTRDYTRKAEEKRIEKLYKEIEERRLEIEKLREMASNVGRRIEDDREGEERGGTEEDQARKDAQRRT